MNFLEININTISTQSCYTLYKRLEKSYQRLNDVLKPSLTQRTKIRQIVSEYIVLFEINTTSLMLF